MAAKSNQTKIIFIVALCLLGLCIAGGILVQKLFSASFEIGYTIGKGSAMVTQGQYPAAEEKYNEALEKIAKHLEHKEISAGTASHLKAHVLAKIGFLYTKEQDYTKAESKFKEAMDLFDHTKLTMVARSDRAECLKQYAALLRLENKATEADALDALAAKDK